MIRIKKHHNVFFVKSRQNHVLGVFPHFPQFTNVERIRQIAQKNSREIPEFPTRMQFPKLPRKPDSTEKNGRRSNVPVSSKCEKYQAADFHILFLDKSFCSAFFLHIYFLKIKNCEK